MKGQIIQNIESEKYFLILDVDNLNISTGTIFLCLDQDKKISRYIIIRNGKSVFKLVSLEEQIKIYNEHFYTHIKVPEHLIYSIKINK